MCTSLIILTQYFPPETGAPQNRLYELAQRMQSKGVSITVLTAMPNYPAMKVHDKYRGKIFASEEMNGIKVYRSWIYVSSKKNNILRLINYFSFVLSSMITGVFVLRKSSFLLVESPPLFLGISAYFLSKLKRTNLIFNVSDLWPESAEKLDFVTNKSVLKLAYKMEAFFYKKAKLITAQTQGIVKNIQQRFPSKDVYWLKNGVDLSVFNPDIIYSNWREQNGFKETDILILYAGILGYAQGLETIIQASLKIKSHSYIKFIFLGTGPVKEKLVLLKEELKAENVIFFEPVTKQEIPQIVKAADVSLVPLKKLDLFLGAIPSKIFENLAMAKPLLLGVDGEARDLFDFQAKASVYFEPENEDDLAKKVLLISENKQLREELGNNGRRFVKEYFDRDKIAESFVQKLNTVYTTS